MNINSGKIQQNNCTIHFAGSSETGCVRSHNEDSFTLLPQVSLFAVADGVGGLDAGEIASKNTTDCIDHFFSKGEQKRNRLFKIFSDLFSFQKIPPQETLQEVISLANTKVYNMANSLKKKMATTIVVLQFHDSQVIVSNVGDSRAYLLRNNILGQITVDHTLSMSLLMAGALSNSDRSTINRHVITRAIGSQQSVTTDNHMIKCRSDDFFLLCSDGLTDMLSDDMICRTAEANAPDVTNMVRELIKKANDAGGRDNITVIAIQIDATV